MTFWKLGKQHYLAAGKHGAGDEIHQAGCWCLYYLANIENRQSSEKLAEFGYLNEAKAFARDHNAAQPPDF